jgi:hypothetical protein
MVSYYIISEIYVHRVIVNLNVRQLYRDGTEEGAMTGVGGAPLSTYK